MESTTVQFIGMGITLLITGANAAFFVVIKFNDMLHISKKVDDLVNKVEKVLEKHEVLDKDFAKAQARCEERHKL